MCYCCCIIITIIVTRVLFWYCYCSCGSLAASHTGTRTISISCYFSWRSLTFGASKLGRFDSSHNQGKIMIITNNWIPGTIFFLLPWLNQSQAITRQGIVSGRMGLNRASCCTIASTAAASQYYTKILNHKLYVQKQTGQAITLDVLLQHIDHFKIQLVCYFSRHNFQCEILSDKHTRSSWFVCLRFDFSLEIWSLL